MKTVNVAESTGQVLDYLVAKCVGGSIRTEHGVFLDQGDGYEYFTPTVDWAQGGPIKEEHGIGTLFNAGSACRKPCWFATPDDQQVSTSYEGESFDPCYMVNEEPGQYGPTELIAAMRCLAVSKLGPTAEVPEELLA